MVHVETMKLESAQQLFADAIKRLKNAEQDREATKAADSKAHTEVLNAQSHLEAAARTLKQASIHSLTGDGVSAIVRGFTTDR
jgi:multidrug resistance efflux pump